MLTWVRYFCVGSRRIIFLLATLRWSIRWCAWNAESRVKKFILRSNHRSLVGTDHRRLEEAAE